MITDPARLRALRATELLGTERLEPFDRLTRLAASFLNVPATFLSLVDQDRDFYLADCGFGEPLATTRELRGVTFCHYTVQSTAPLVIQDTAGHPVYRDVPTVKSLGVAAYLGIPLVVDGQVIGALCAIDTRPHRWSPDEIHTLTDLAAIAVDGIELRHQTRRHAEARAALERANVELRQAKIAADDANRAKADFLASMSHELRTPLNSVIGFANVLCRNAGDTLGQRERKYAERIAANGRHLLELVNRILDLSKIERREVEIRREPVRVDELARMVCDDLGVTAAGAGVALVAEVTPPGAAPAPLTTDESKLRQVVINLVGNALKFTPPGGEVRVTLTCDPHSGAPRRLDVADTGIGIAPEAQERVFEAFEQATAETAARYGGTGLGLSISRALCQSLGFALTLRSELGKGSTFSIDLAPGGARRAD